MVDGTSRDDTLINSGLEMKVDHESTQDRTDRQRGDCPFHLTVVVVENHVPDLEGTTQTASS